MEGTVAMRRTVARLMAFEAATLATFSTLHLAGAIHSAQKPFNESGAGIAEAVICVVLLIGVAALVSSPATGRRTALFSIGFAIVGFIVGLTFTVSGGAAIDLAYHSVMLPILIATAAFLMRPRPVRDTRARTT